MRRATTHDDAAEDEVDIDLLSGTMRRVFMLAAGMQPDALEPDIGWVKAAATLAAMFADQGDGDLAMKWVDVALMLYRSATRARGDEPQDFAELPENTRRCWEATGRHAANVIAGGAEAVRAIANHENHWINYGNPELFHKK